MNKHILINVYPYNGIIVVIDILVDVKWYPIMVWICIYLMAMTLSISPYAHWLLIFLLWRNIYLDT
jgi:hypothetical protein